MLDYGSSHLWGTLRAVWLGVFIGTVGSAMDKFLPSFYARVHGLTVAETGLWLGIGTGVVAGAGGAAHILPLPAPCVVHSAPLAQGWREGG